MSIRRLSRCLSITALTTLFILGPGLPPSMAGDGGVIPPNPVTSQSAEWSAEFGTGLYALTLIY